MVIGAQRVATQRMPILMPGVEDTVNSPILEFGELLILENISKKHTSMTSNFCPPFSIRTTLLFALQGMIEQS
jgi:hypothetical protein